MSAGDFSPACADGGARHGKHMETQARRLLDRQYPIRMEKTGQGQSAGSYPPKHHPSRGRGQDHPAGLRLGALALGTLEDRRGVKGPRDASPYGKGEWSPRTLRTNLRTHCHACLIRIDGKLVEAAHFDQRIIEPDEYCRVQEILDSSKRIGSNTKSLKNHLMPEASYRPRWNSPSDAATADSRMLAQ